MRIGFEIWCVVLYCGMFVVCCVAVCCVVLSCVELPWRCVALCCVVLCVVNELCCLALCGVEMLRSVCLYYSCLWRSGLLSCVVL